MTQASDIVADLDRLYRASVERLQQALNRYITDGTTPDPETRTDGSFAYPELRVTYRGGVNKPIPRRSFGRLVEAGDYRISVTRPAMFAEYLTEQLTFLIEEGTRIAQLVLVRAASAFFAEVEFLESAADGRGEGGFGSSGS